MWDLFISHASEDKASVARPLAEILREKGIRVWIDETELCLGDSLRAKIDEGLAQSRFGLVIVSRAFLSKRWPIQELNGLSRPGIRGPEGYSTDMARCRSQIDRRTFSDSG